MTYGGTDRSYRVVKWLDEFTRIQPYIKKFRQRRERRLYRGLKELLKWFDQCGVTETLHTNRVVKTYAIGRVTLTVSESLTHETINVHIHDVGRENFVVIRTIQADGNGDDFVVDLFGREKMPILGELMVRMRQFQ